jgi:hypothetical protein
MQKQNKVLAIVFFLLFNPSSFLKTFAQAHVIGFYNCENFYDTIHQAHVIDEDFLPQSEKHYNRIVYQTKSMHIAQVIDALGKLGDNHCISLMGVVEIENKTVIETVINEPILKKYHLKFIHFDSKDARGVDVALLYNPSKFTPYQFRPYSLTDETHFNDYATRDILYVYGRLDSTWVHILVNHWPSRRGGAKISNSKRLWAATKCKNIMDSISERDPDAKWIVMGDFNDNPTDKSVLHLGLKNPFVPLYKNGIGSLAFNDSWHLFDQIMLSNNWVTNFKNTMNRQMLEMVVERRTLGKVSKKKSSIELLTICKPIVYKNLQMVETRGKYKGYPKRTYNGNTFISGYSDHYPVALILK